jgi:ethanolamine utilization protein EutQ (cupin superfamily)
MAISTKQMTKRRFDSPDEHRTFPLGSNDVVTLGDFTLGLARFEPGWKWSESLKPRVGTESCQVEHLGYILSGRLYTRMDDGSEMEFGPGDLVYVPPGHDGWTVGNESVVFLQIEGAAKYAKKQ